MALSYSAPGTWAGKAAPGEGEPGGAQGPSQELGSHGPLSPGPMILSWRDQGQDQKGFPELGKVLAAEVPREQAGNVRTLPDVGRAWWWASPAGRVGSEQESKDGPGRKTPDHVQQKAMKG